ncbi:sulfatase-like hydrolase/transferase [Flammeovirga aprica]|uniref:Sulfatase-like hydrolase/transferase n=1 Tax=Flammeovirga aprica JL-4 TaxID=694437 RepID=A0A7X9RYZ9_9BACT|nr:sulfatase-like hydrolase/transferase [Flammeovirga aprica]NME71311.1 sulfatase-like hydrolase/transferase [Flammeovirga aprica JL-4]
MKKNHKHFILVFAGLLLFTSKSFSSSENEPPKKKPNILWIITDDHRPDALECYNEAVYGQKESPLGYVSSPNINKLASEGVLFTNAFCNAPVCGPSRGSMITGRYPFRTGHYAFELTHQNPDFIQPSVPQILKKTGYQTAQFGKAGEYIYKWGPGQGYRSANHYEYTVHFKHNLQKNNLGDLWGDSAFGKINGKTANLGKQEKIKRQNGQIEKYFVKKNHGEISQKDIQTRKRIEKEFEILRSYTRSNTTLIIGGENPMPADQTVDAIVVDEFKAYLENQNKEFTTAWGQKAKGANADQPQMINLSFHLPHTPILPPKSQRDIFKKKKYKVPAFDQIEYDKMPPQLQKMHNNMNMTKMTKKEIQQTIQDYYAFCAHGDELIGQAVEAFKKYCKKNNQEYLIVFTVGDHGWHLGEQGIEAKYTGWKQSTNGAMVVVSSDKQKVPAGLVRNQLIEYVDIAPTLLSASGEDITSSKYDYLDGMQLQGFIKNEEEQRAYTLGETKVVVGHRAYLRSNNFAFSMRTRPSNKSYDNKNIKWALNCPVEKAELALYDLRVDPDERNNVANSEEYKALAEWFRKKLGNIVLGDRRVECDWSKANSFAISNFAEGADDKKLDIPENIIPKPNE